MPDQINPPEAPKGWESKKSILSKILPQSSVSPDPSSPQPTIKALAGDAASDPKEEKARRELEHVDDLKRRIDQEMRERKSHLQTQDIELRQRKDELDRIESELRRREMQVAGPGAMHHLSQDVVIKEKMMGEKESRLKALEVELEDSRRVLIELERELRSKEELINGKEKIAEKLKNESFSREREITRREEILKGKEGKFEDRINKVRELEAMYKSLNIKDLVTFDRLLQEKEGILDRKENEIRSEISDEKAKRTSLIQKEKELNVREADLDSKTRDVEEARQVFNARNVKVLAFKEKLVAEKEALLAKKEQELIQIERRMNAQVQKEKELIALEAEQKKKEYELAADRRVLDEQNRRYHKIISERENLEAIHEKLKKKEEILRKMDQGVRKRMEYYQGMVKKSPEIEKRITFIMNKGKILEAMEDELRALALRLKEEGKESAMRIKNAQNTLRSAALIREKEHILQQKEDIMDSMESEISAYNKDKEELIVYIEMLNREKVLLQEQHGIFLGEMLRMSAERDFNLGEAQKTISALAAERDSLAPIASEAKEDIRIINEKENELTRLVRDLERRQAFISKEEARVKGVLLHVQELEKQAKGREKNIQRMERSISKEEERFKAEIRKIEEAQELKREVPKLRKIYNKLRTDILKINEDALAKRMTLKEFESQLLEREHALVLKEKEIMAIRERIKIDEANWSRLERVADSEKIYRGIRTIDRLGKAYDHPAKGDVYAMIENARTLIVSNQTDHAAELIQEIEKACDKAQPSEQRLLNYEILELKNDLKLASLA